MMHKNMRSHKQGGGYGTDRRGNKKEVSLEMIEVREWKVAQG